MPSETATPTVHNDREWYVAALSSEVRNKPLQRRILGKPIVLFRDKQQKVAALDDKCPHRFTELSLGQVVDGTIECPYHGWRFDRNGECTLIPGIESRKPNRNCATPAYPVREIDGYVWVFPNLEVEPEQVPFDTKMGTEGYAVFRQAFDMAATLETIVDNFSDPIHPAYLHRGIFRRTPKKTRRVSVHITRGARSVEWEFHNQAPLRGLAPLLLGSRGGKMQHLNSFHMPGITRGEVRIGRHLHMFATGIYTPVDEYQVRMYGDFRYSGIMPQSVANVVLRPFAMTIIKQDYDVLKSQVMNIQRSGGEFYRSTELDTFGLLARQLMRKWANGEPPEPDSRFERTFDVWL